MVQWNCLGVDRGGKAEHFQDTTETHSLAGLEEGNSSPFLAKSRHFSRKSSSRILHNWISDVLELEEMVRGP